jgi:FSR family fosmidomycin resistance protein-like MFS transporter
MKPAGRLEATVKDRNSGPFWLGASVVAGAHFANDAMTSVLSTLLPLLAIRFELAPSEAALLVGIFAVSMSLPQPFFGSLADRFGGHLVGAIGLGVTALLLVTLSAVSSVTWLSALLAIGGLGSAALHPAGMTLSRAASTASPGFAAALFTAAGMAGGASGPILASGITAGWGFEGLAWTAGPVLFAAVMLFGFAPRARVPVVRTVTPPLVGLRLLRGSVGRLAFVTLCANFAVLTFTSAVPLWLLRERGVVESSPILGLTLATFWVAAAIGGILGGTLTRWISTKHLVVASLALSILALEIVLVTTPGSASYFTSIAVSGALLFVHAPLVAVRAQELSPGSESAVAGLLLGGTSAAAGLIYALLGPAQSAFGTGTVMAVACFGLVPAAAVALGVLGGPKEDPMEDEPTLALALCSCAG